MLSKSNIKLNIIDDQFRFFVEFYIIILDGILSLRTEFLIEIIVNFRSYSW